MVETDAVAKHNPCLGKGLFSLVCLDSRVYCHDHCFELSWTSLAKFWSQFKAIAGDAEMISLPQEWHFCRDSI